MEADHDALAHDHGGDARHDTFESQTPFLGFETFDVHAAWDHARTEAAALVGCRSRFLAAYVFGGTISG